MEMPDHSHEQRHEKEDRIAYQRSQRHVFGHNGYGQEGCKGDGEDARIERGHKSCRCRNALSSLELQIEREIMRDDRACTRIQLQDGKNVRVGLPEQSSHKHDRQKTLEKIPDKGNQPQFRPQSPDHVGRSRVAAPILTDVDPVEPSDNITGLHQTKGISDCQTY